MVESLIAWLIVGAIAGWLAGLIVKGFGFGLLGNIVVHARATTAFTVRCFEGFGLYEPGV